MERTGLWVVAVLFGGCIGGSEEGGSEEQDIVAECQEYGGEMCGEDCVDLASDDDHCGECGNSCGFSEGCTDGVCRCDPGQCNGCETDCFYGTCLTSCFTCRSTGCEVESYGNW